MCFAWFSIKVVMSQGSENSTEQAKTHTASPKFIDRMLGTRVLGRKGNETHKREAS